MTISETNMALAKHIAKEHLKGKFGHSQNDVYGNPLSDRLHNTLIIAAALQARDERRVGRCEMDILERLKKCNPDDILESAAFLRRVSELQAKLARYEKALRFYAEREYEEYGIGEERGTTAREALEAKE